MKLLSLSLRGAIGIYEGIGQDEISIDFTKFDSGLIAVIGKNGSGKTTLIENLHPYPMLVSHDGALSNHFRLRDSHRLLKLESNGIIYRAEIYIDSHTGKTEGYLYKGSEPLNDGKISTYKVAVEGIFGTPELFFKSIFCSQNMKSITSLTAGKRKELFLELLNLQIYDKYLEYAKKKAEEVEKEIDKLSGSLATLVKRKDSINAEAIEKEIVESNKTINLYESMAKDLKIKIAEHQKSINAIELEIMEFDKKKQSVEQKRIELKKYENELDEYTDSYAETTKSWKNQIAECEKVIDRASKIIENKDKIDAALALLETLKTELSEMEIVYEQYNNLNRQYTVLMNAYYEEEAEYNKTVADAKTEISRSEQNKKTALMTLDADIRALETQLRNNENDFKLVDEVPCKGMGTLPNRCKLLSKSIGAGECIPDIKKMIDEKKAQIPIIENKYQVEIDVISKAIAKLAKPSNTESSKIKEAIKALNIEGTKLVDLRTRVSKLEGEKWDVLRSEYLLAESTIEVQRDKINAFDNQLSEIKKSGSKTLAELEKKIDDCEATIAGFDQQGLTSLYLNKIKTNELRQNAEVEIDKIKDLINLARSTILANTGKLVDYNSILDEIIVIELAIKQGQKKLEDWRFIMKACGKDGIPALELDIAGIEVTNIANDLLVSTFGSQYQIRFETTKLSADGKKQVETFDIKVFSDGTEKNIENLSGGQRVWIESALTDAIGIYLSQKSDRDYLTKFADEKDGALDQDSPYFDSPNNKQHYLEMLRTSFKLGKRYHTLLITQTPDIYSQIQQKIVMRPEKSMVELIY